MTVTDCWIVTDLWASSRPTGKYRWRWPGTVLRRLEMLLEGFKDKQILQMFSGISDLGDTIDINPEVGPSWVWDLTKAIPFLADDSYDIVIADPPYVDFKPYSFVKEAVRVLRPGGFLVILHFLVYITPKGCGRWGCIAVTSGPNMRMRALNIFRKEEEVVSHRGKEE